MPQIQIKRKGYLPFGKAQIQVHDLKFSLKGGQQETTELPEGEYTITIQMQGITTTRTIRIERNSSAIVIKYAMPTILLAFGILPICALIWFDDKMLIKANTIFFLTYFPIMLYFQLAPNKLFKCTVLPHE